MKWPFKKRGNIILIVAIALVLVLAGLFSGKPKTTALTQTVQRGQLVQTVEVTGVVETVTELNLAFEQTGTVAEVNVRVGQDVIAGEVLAALSGADVAADVARAQANLDLQIAGSRSEDLDIARANVALAEAAVEDAKNRLAFADSSQDLTGDLGNAQLTQAQEGLKQAEITLDQTLENNQNVLLSAVTNVLLELDGSLIDIRSAVSSADQVLGAGNQNLNQDFKNTLGAADPQLLTDATNQFGIAEKSRDTAEKLDLNLTAQSAQVDIELAIDAVMSALNDTSLLLLYTRQVLDATPASIDLTTSELDAFKSTIDLSRGNVQVQTSSLTTAALAYSNGFLDTQHDQETAEAGVGVAQAALSAAQATQAQNDLGATQNFLSADTLVIQRQNELIKAKSELSKLELGPRPVDLAPYFAELQAAQARLAKTQIISPIDGVITSIDLRQGEQSAPGKVVVAVQAVGDQYMVPVNIPESDIAKVKLNDAVTVTLDAVGKSKKYTGKVVAIDASETLIEGVVYYQADVVFDAGQDLEDLRSGLSADITIETDKRADTLYLSQRAVLERDGIPYVRVQTTGDEFEERTVVLGLRGDDGLVEILSGVSENETVIVSLNE